MLTGTDTNSLLKAIFLRLLKNAKMQDASFDKLRINSLLWKGEGCHCDE
jgi:hypothetical protein